MRRKICLALAIVLIPLWTVGAIHELRDSYLVKKEGRVTTGTIVSAKYSGGRGGSYRCNISYSANGQDYHKEFRIWERDGAAYFDKNEQIANPAIDVVYASSRPTAAELAMYPSDPVWVSALLACVGLSVVGGTLFFLAFSKKK